MASTLPQQMAQASSWQPKGYHRLAKFMGRSNDIAIFRRFNELNMLGLLSLQAEIVALRADFFRQCSADDVSGMPYEKFSENFKSLRDAGSAGNEEQYTLLLDIRRRMKEYNELILQVSQLSTLNKPLKYDLKFLQEWLRDPKGGSDFLVKNNIAESRLYDDDDMHDLFTFSQLSGRSFEQDPFFNLLGKRLLRWYHYCIGQHRKNRSRTADAESKAVDYDASSIQRVANVVATVLSSVLPLIAILILDHFQNTRTRIYISVGITAVFALVLALFTNARRVEIFAATATFAAVEVVFIGSVVQPKDRASQQ